VTSVSHAAVALARKESPGLHNGLVIGGGEMAYLAAQALHRHGVGRLRCINRTYARAEKLARGFQGEALEWAQMPSALAEADVVISATGAPHTVIQTAQVEMALAQRPDRPLVIVDIALPRDVELAASELPGVHYYDFDALEAFVQRNLARREAALEAVAAIIDEEAERFLEWERGHRVAPLIAALRAKAEAMAAEEVAAALRRLDPLEAGQQQVIEQLTHRIVSKLLHEPTTRLKADSAYADAVRELFSLDPLESH
jgi:glutamyl-tRNA reductase